MEPIALSPLLILTLFAVALIGGSIGALLTYWRIQSQQDDCLPAPQPDEAALRQSEAKFRRLVDANLVGVYVADFNGTIYESNEAFLKMVGYSHADLQAGRLNWMDMTPTEYKSLDQQAIAQQKATGACEPFEKEYYRQDGSRIPVLFGCAVFEPTQGRTIGFVLDLTTRKQAEAALRQSESRFRKLFNANLIGIVVADLEGNVSEANDAYLKMLGYTRDEFRAGKVNWATMTPAQYNDVDQRAIAEMRATGECTPFEKEYHRKDGSLVPIVLGCTVLDEVPENTIGFMLDLTQQKQVESALRHSEAKLRRLIEANLIGVTVTHWQGQMFEANDVFLDMVGYTREDLRAGQLSWAKMTPPEYVEIDRRATEELARTGTFTPFEKEYWRKDGSRVPVLIGHATFDQSNQISIGFVLDLTDRKRAEAAAVLEERNRMAREIHDTLAQAFTSIMVHLEVASYKLENDPAIVRQCVETSYELAQSGLAEARRSVAALRPHYLEEGNLYDALYLLGHQIFAHHPTQLVCCCQGARYSFQPEIEHHLLRIGQEALMNACKYANATLVELYLNYEPEQCNLRIKDDGVGFEPDKVDSDHHFGLRGMTERAHQIGATLTLQTAPEQGTEVTVVVQRGGVDGCNQ